MLLDRTLGRLKMHDLKMTDKVARNNGNNYSHFPVRYFATLSFFQTFIFRASKDIPWRVRPSFSSPLSSRPWNILSVICESDFFVRYFQVVQPPIVLTLCPALPPVKSFPFRHTRYLGPALADWTYYRLLRRCYCTSTAHCNKSRDPVDLLEAPPPS